MFKRKVPLLIAVFAASNAFAGDANAGSDAGINLPSLEEISFWGGKLTGHAILFFGLIVCAVGFVAGGPSRTEHQSGHPELDLMDSGAGR